MSVCRELVANGADDVSFKRLSPHGTWILFVGAASPLVTFGNREHGLHKAIASSIGVVYEHPPSCARLKWIVGFGGPTPEHNAFVAASFWTRRVGIHEKRSLQKWWGRFKRCKIGAHAAVPPLSANPTPRSRSATAVCHGWPRPLLTLRRAEPTLEAQPARHETRESMSLTTNDDTDPTRSFK
jgi:hypothetical protein